MTKRRPPAKPVPAERGASDALMAFAGVTEWKPKAPPPGTSVEFMNLLALAEAAARDRDAALALGYLKRAARIDPTSPKPPFLMARVLIGDGRGGEAIRALHEAVRLDPRDEQAKTMLARVIESEPMPDYRWMDGDVIAACLATEGIGHQDFVDIALRLLAHKDMADVLATGAREGWDAGAARLLGSARRLLTHPLLLGALRQGLNVHVPFERLLTAARRRVLLDPTGADAPVEFLGALAEQCFLNEHVFHAAADEDAAVERLAEAIARDPAGVPERDVLVVALYRPLVDLPCADGLLARGRVSEALGRALALTITEPRADRAAVDDVRVLAAPRDEVSRRVQAQYEENPYPRWRNLTPPVAGAAFHGLARHLDTAVIKRLAHDPRVLVAGCGTGAHAIPCAIKYGRGAKVTAIDLSRPSLAYASRRALALGLQGITFLQADILELSPSFGPFDIIECGGVLHHMADPIRGWRMLAGVLAPGGVMKLGLYSERARRFVREAIADAKTQGLPPTADGIRAYRHRLITMVPGPWAVPLGRYRDFYSTSQCRDLLFNAVEHRFTPLGLRDAIGAVGLVFRGFQVSGAVLAAYRERFPDDPRGLNLEHWDAFEAERPDTFEAMFQFWCVKPA